MNVFGGGSSPSISYKYERATSTWNKHYNIYDHLGTLQQTYKNNGISTVPTSMQTQKPFGSDNWSNDNLTTKESTLLNWIGKEKDNESKLGNHGVRKYEYETGRFISIDPLWAKYYGWTPYQYTRNNPINAVDFNGGAEFFLSDGTILNDQVNDGLLYASGNFDLNNSKIFNDDGSTEINYKALRQNSKQLPNKEVLKKILSLHSSHHTGEAGGAGTLDNYYYGGRNKVKYNDGDKIAEATNEVMVGFYQAFGDGELPSILYFVHDHPYGTSINPSEKDGDRSFLLAKQKSSGNYNMYGILIQGWRVNIFDTSLGGQNDVIIDRTVLEKHIE